MDALFWMLTERCTRRCPYCFNHQRAPASPGKENLDDAPAVARQILGAGVGQVIFTGGEPLLLERDLLGLLDLFQGISTVLLTNGDPLTLPLARSLAEVGLDLMILQLTDLEGPHALAQSRRRLRLAREAGIDGLSTIAVITSKSWRHIDAMEAMAKEEGVGLVLQPAWADSRPDLALTSLPPHELRRAMGSLTSWAHRHSLADYGGLMSKAVTGQGQGPRQCFMGRQAAVLTPQGDLLPCFHRPDFRVGNLCHSPLHELLPPLDRAGASLRDAPCFGIHCVSLFVG